MKKIQLFMMIVLSLFLCHSAMAEKAAYAMARKSCPGIVDYMDYVVHDPEKISKAYVDERRIEADRDDHIGFMHKFWLGAYYLAMNDLLRADVYFRKAVRSKANPSTESLKRGCSEMDDLARCMTEKVLTVSNMLRFSARDFLEIE